MAKTQSLSLNPTKISGTCGNLMCCLRHEEEAYEDLQKDAPQPETVVDTPLGKGYVTDVNLLRRNVKVKIETQNETVLKTFPFEQIGYVVNGKYLKPSQEYKPEIKLPAFDPPKYQPLPVKHETILEHSVKPKPTKPQVLTPPTAQKPKTPVKPIAKQPPKQAPQVAKAPPKPQQPVRHSQTRVAIVKPNAAPVTAPVRQHIPQKSPNKK